MSGFPFRVLEQFTFQLVVAEVLFTLHLARRRGFALRLAAFLLAFVLGYDAVVTLTSVQLGRFATNVLLFSLFAGTLCGLWLCYRAKFTEILFCGLGAFAAQNFSYNLHRFLKNLLGFAYQSRLSWLVSFLCLLVVYTVAYVVYVRRLRQFKLWQMDRIRVAISVLSVLLLTSFLSTSIPDVVSGQLVYNYLYAMAGDLLVLCVQYGLMTEGFLHRQNEAMEQILFAERRQHETSKENIELINRKCHDLKHQIAALRTNPTGVDSEEAIREIENAVLIYDSAIKTGNETLDMILMEKLLYCEKYKIKLTCVADGAQLGFMKTLDIYTLFGNLLDNAIESVSKEPDEEKRIISFNLGCQQKLFRLHFENYYSGTLHFVDGLPQTTKADKSYHGYGVKSIRHIVEKYGGNLLITAGEELFCMDIVIPLA